VTYDDMPVGTVLRNRVTDTVLIRTHHGSMGWLAVRRGRPARRVAITAAVERALDLVDLVEKAPEATR
jgi:hypothetical protein